MHLAPRTRTAVVVALVAAALVTVPAASASAVAAGTEPTPSSAPTPSVPSAAEVEEAKEAAEAAAAEVERVTAQVEKAERRLEALQRQVAESVTGQEAAERALAAAEAAVVRASEDLASARRTRETAGRALSQRAALIYMQGGDLQNLTALLLTPPDAMSDLVVVLDRNAAEVRSSLDAADSAAADAAATERRLAAARDARAAAAEVARRARAAAETEAASAGAEAARLAASQEVLTARLERLSRTVEDLVAQRRAAAALGRGELLGLLTTGSSTGTGPAAAQATARAMLPAFGWDDAEFACLVTLWHKESGWSWSATNPSSGAYGIPQSLPGWKMASAGSDWLTNPATQIAWGLDYIDSVYGSPCSALSKFNSRSPHWY